jgi:hypothetical protein
MNIDRYEFLLYSKLIIVMLNWRLYQAIDTFIYTNTRQRISILKMYKTIKQFHEKMKEMIRGKKAAIHELINQLKEIGNEHLLHEDRKGRINWRNVEII